MSPKTLNDYCEFIVDCLHKTAPIENGETGYYSIRTPDIGRGRLIIENANRVSKETYEKWTIRAVPQAGDLILAREAPVGNVGIVQENMRVCCGQRTVHIRPDKTKIYPDYLVYLMMGDEIQGIIKGQSQGATVAHLNMEDIRALVLPELPSIPTQRKIADIIAAYDDLIEVNTRRIRILEQMAQSVYREWFGKVDVKSLPGGWELGILEDALVLQRGFDLPKQDRKEGNVPIYASTGITGSHIEAKVKGPGVVTGRSGSLGTVIYIEEDYWPLNTTLWIKEFRRVTPLYAYYLLKELDFSQFNSGAAVPTLNRNDVHGLPVVIPSKDILSKFDEFVLPLYGLRRNLTMKNANLRRTRDLLLPRLVSGEVTVNRI